MERVRLHGRIKWRCLCDCGNISTPDSSDLKNGRIKSCGCLRRDMAGSAQRLDLTGKRFGRLVVIATLSRGPVTWKCLCDCGKTIIRETERLTSGARSCGCYRSDLLSSRRRILPYQAVFNKAKAGAAKRGLEFDISLEFYQSLAEKPCHYCDASLVWSEHTGVRGGTDGRRGHNLDRKDNNMGYTEDNVVPCCPICNILKMDHIGYEEMKFFIGPSRKAYRERPR
jgi:hypothetical protein